MTSNPNLEEVTGTSLLSGVLTTPAPTELQIKPGFDALPRLVKYCSTVLQPPVELASSPGAEQGGSGNTKAGSSSSGSWLSCSVQTRPICHSGADGKVFNGPAINLVSTGLYIGKRGTV